MTRNPHLPLKLSIEWDQKIEREAEAYVAALPLNNDYELGVYQGMKCGYDHAAIKYASLLIEAQERIKSLEEALNKIKWMAAVHTGINSNILGIWKCANESLLPNNKQK